MKIAKDIHGEPIECTAITSKNTVYRCYICDAEIHPCNDKKLGEGRKKDYYFAHYGNCSGNLESYIHRVAKEIIAAASEIILPDKRFAYTGVELECTSLHNSLRPDVLLDKEVAIEICYKNPKADKQISIYRDLNISVVEIYLDSLDMNSSLAELKHAVLTQTDNRAYLFKRAEPSSATQSSDPNPILVILFMVLAFLGLRKIAGSTRLKASPKSRSYRKYCSFNSKYT